MELVKELSLIGAMENWRCWTLFRGYFVRSSLFLPFFHFSFLVLYLLYAGRETEERMTQIGRMNEEKQRAPR